MGRDNIEPQFYGIAFGRAHLLAFRKVGCAVCPAVGRMLRNAALASLARDANTAGRLTAGGRARERSRCIPGGLLAVMLSLSTDAASIKEKSGHGVSAFL